MKILFVHQNFPGQFKNLAPALAAKGHEVTALGIRDLKRQEWMGVRYLRYSPQRSSSKDIHPWASDIETKIIRGEACYQTAMQMRQQGYTPDVIIAHHGWGEPMFLRDVWPDARIGLYCEFYYHAVGYDLEFDPEFPPAEPHAAPRMRIRNLNNMVHFEVAQGGISPTRWQADSYPESFRSRISVIHDGIDTDEVKPRQDVVLTLADGTRLDRNSEIITFVNRNIEPYRGAHIFFRALPELLRRRPNAHVLIIGADGVSYGAKPPGGKSWKQIFLEEVKPQAPAEAWQRVHFLGTMPYNQFIGALQLSTVHVYLTYPFVLSWSLLEAMSCGAAIVASDTPPLQEAIHHDETGRLVDFFNIAGLTDEICNLLDDPAARERLGRNAREFAQKNYDLKTVCLPRQLEWVNQLASADTLQSAN